MRSWRNMNMYHVFRIGKIITNTKMSLTMPIGNNSSLHLVPKSTSSEKM